MADITTINSLEFSMYHPPIGRHLVTQYQRLTKKKNIKLPTSGPKQNKSIREGTVSSLRTWTYHGGI